MKAIVIHEFGGPEKLQIAEVPKPVINDNEVLIHVSYAGVNPVDWKIREGYLKDRMPYEFPIIPGWDVSGTIVEAGKNVHHLKNGDAVYAYARKPEVKWGTYAEYISLDAKNVALKPNNLSFAQAATIPLVTLTAWQSLFDAVQLKANETIFITAGSGGVGSVAIQLAKNAGAKIITTASLSKKDYVSKLGADVVIDHNADVVSQVKKSFPNGIDVVFDCFGSEAFTSALSCLKPGGRIVSILEHLDPEKAKSLNISSYYVFVSPDGEQLNKIKSLIEAEKIKPSPIEELPLADAAIAHQKLREGKVLGKLVLKV